MVDAERVLRLLVRVRQDVKTLREHREVAEGQLAIDAIKYRFIAAIEGASRIAHHLAVSEDWGVPESNSDAFSTLGAEGVIESDLASRVGAAGFRNVLVHQYTEVDDDLVLANLGSLADLDAYVTQVGTWMQDQPAS